MTATEAMLWALVLLPAAAGAALLSGPLWGARPGRGWGVVSAGVSALVLGLSLGCAVARPAVSVPFVAGADFGLHVDGLAAVVTPAIAAVTVFGSAMRRLGKATDIGAGVEAALAEIGNGT